MSDIRQIIAKNLANLRKESKLTQSELAEKLNYSDKSVSKWERSNSIPSIEILIELANLYGVTLDYLVHDNESGDSKQKFEITRPHRNNRLIITMLSVLIVWLAASVIFVFLNVLFSLNVWILYIWAVPVSTIVLIVFNSLWGKWKYALGLLTLLEWSILASFYIQFIEYNIWELFIIGVPLQIITCLWIKLKNNAS